MKQRLSKTDRKRKQKKRNKIIKRILLVVIALLLIVAIVGASLFIYYQKKGKDSLKPDLENCEYQEIIEYDGHKYAFNEDVIAFGFLGVDQRDLDNPANSDFVGASDTNIVIAINTVSGEVKLICIPRETVTDIDVYKNGKFIGTQKERLTLAYSYGDGKELSCTNTIDAMSRVLKSVPIQKYYALDLDGIGAINDSIGGVMLKSKIDLPSRNVSAGEVVTLKGDMAESYVRSRSMTDINASFDRTDRQVQYLQSFVSQIMPAVLLNFSTVNKIYNVGTQYSRTNLNASDTTYLASLLISKGTSEFDATVLEGEMKTEKDSAGDNTLHALFTPDDDKLMQIVLDTFYLRID